MMCELSIVILSYKAETFLEEFVHQVHTELENDLKNTFEIILVANYDDDFDTTPIIAKKIANDYKNIKVLALKKRGRMGWDMRKGLEESKGRYICVLDGDGQMPASDIISVYSVIKTGKFDIVKTYRAIRHDGWYRRLLSKTYNIIFNLLYRPSIHLRDINAKPKIITREAYNQLSLQSNDWFTDAEIMIQAIHLQLSICEIATVFYKNERRKSFVGFKTIFEFIHNLFYYRYFRT